MRWQHDRKEILTSASIKTFEAAATGVNFHKNLLLPGLIAF
jgi:hypothetical protein